MSPTWIGDLPPEPASPGHLYKFYPKCHCSGTISVRRNSLYQPFLPLEDKMSPVLLGKTSPTFPSSQGDFILQSCDKVNFYVWRLVLQLSSAVFGDMFELAPKVAARDYSTSEEASVRARRRSRHSSESPRTLSPLSQT